MKIFIAYSSVGAGHGRAAQAIHNYFKENCKDCEISLIDVLKRSNPVFSFLYSKGYDFLVKYLPSFWSFLFWLTEKGSFASFWRSQFSWLSRLQAAGFSSSLIKENPDYVLSTHFLPSEITAYLKRKKKITSKLVTVVTDFGVHPFWIAPATDIYIVASNQGKDFLLEQGVPNESIKRLGVPVDQKFFKKLYKAETIKTFGLENIFTVLVISGSYGIGPIEKLAEELSGKVQLIIVCGRNRALERKMNLVNYPKVKIFGFTDKIDELMSAADLLICKAGGLTTSEGLTKGLVPLFMHAIPGQEEENAEILEKMGVAKTFYRLNDLVNFVLELSKSPQKLEDLRNLSDDFHQKNTCQELARVVCQGSSGSCTK